MIVRRLLTTLAAALCLATAAQAAEPPVVLAAASLQEALTDAAGRFAATGHPRPVLSFAASSQLARQIENGAPADMFISADEAWMDDLANRKLITPGSRASFLSNRLVLVAPADHPFTTTIKPGFPLATLLGEGHLAMADVAAVPAGRYGKAALTKLGVWSAIEAKVVQTDNVRSALVFVERGEARAGIVYATDAMASRKVVVAAVFPTTSHPPISYPLGLVVGRANPEARAFRRYLLSDAGGAVFACYGFIVR